MDDPVTTPQGGEGQSQGNETPSEGFQMPEKFQGKSAEEIAQIHTNLEREYTKLKQSGGSPVDLAKIEKLLENKLNSFRPAETKPAETPDEAETKRQMIEQARGLGLAFKDDVEQAREAGRREVLNAFTVKELSQKFDGKDGSPKFDADDMYNFLQTAPEYYKGLPLEKAFKLRFEAEFQDVAIKNALAKNKAPMVPGSTKPGTKPNQGIDTSKYTPEQLLEKSRQDALARVAAQMEG